MRKRNSSSLFRGNHYEFALYICGPLTYILYIYVYMRIFIESKSFGNYKFKYYSVYHFEVTFTSYGFWLLLFLLSFLTTTYSFPLLCFISPLLCLMILGSLAVFCYCSSVFCVLHDHLQVGFKGGNPESLYVWKCPFDFLVDLLVRNHFSSVWNVLLHFGLMRYLILVIFFCLR